MEVEEIQRRVQGGMWQSCMGKGIYGSGVAIAAAGFDPRPEACLC